MDHEYLDKVLDYIARTSAKMQDCQDVMHDFSEKVRPLYLQGQDSSMTQDEGPLAQECPKCVVNGEDCGPWRCDCNCHNQPKDQTNE